MTKVLIIGGGNTMQYHSDFTKTDHIIDMRQDVKNRLNTMNNEDIEFKICQRADLPIIQRPSKHIKRSYRNSSKRIY